MAFQALKTLRERSATQALTRARLKTMLANALRTGDADVVQVNEIACPDPDCPDLTTIVLVMRHGEPTRAIRIMKGLDQVTQDDCERAAGVEARERARTDGYGPGVHR